jgi:hypothetical protein
MEGTMDLKQFMCWLLGFCVGGSCAVTGFMWHDPDLRRMILVVLWVTVISVVSIARGIVKHWG